MLYHSFTVLNTQWFHILTHQQVVTNAYFMKITAYFNGQTTSNLDISTLCIAKDINVNRQITQLFQPVISKSS